MTCCLSMIFIRLRQLMTVGILAIALLMISRLSLGAESEAFANLGDTLHGELTSTSPVNLNDGSRYGRHQFCADNTHTSRLYQYRSAFDANLTLFDDQLNMLTASGRSTIHNGDTLLIQLASNQCATLVVTGSNQQAYGHYQFTATSDDNQSQTLTTNDTLVLQSAQTVALDIEIPTELSVSVIDSSSQLGMSLDGENFHQDAFACGDHELHLNGLFLPGRYELNLLPNGRRFSEKDDAGNNCTAVIFSQNSAVAIQTNAQPLPDNTRNNGQINNGEYFTGVVFPEHINTYQLSLSEMSRVNLNMLPVEFSAEIILLGDGIKQIGGSVIMDGSSTIDVVLPAGEYRVTVGPDDMLMPGTRLDGVYNLGAQITPYRIPLSHSGRLESGRAIAGLHTGADYHYSLLVDKPSRAIIDAMSDYFNPVLTLEGNGVRDSDEHSGEGMNARLEVELEPGTYNVTLSSGSGISYGGLYTLKATLLDQADLQ